MMSIRLCLSALLRNYFFRLKSPVSIQPEINQPVLPCLPLQPSPCVPTLRMNYRVRKGAVVHLGEPNQVLNISYSGFFEV